MEMRLHIKKPDLFACLREIGRRRHACSATSVLQNERPKRGSGLVGRID